MSSSTYLADGNITRGDVVCLVTSKNSQPRVRTASMPLPVSAPIVGVALTDASGGSVTVVDCGGVDVNVTGLTSGIRQPIAVSSSGRCTRTLAGAVWLIGDANESGDLEIRPRIFDSLDVRLFGAAGDGVTDDSTPIQAAIAAYGGSSGRIVFTNGEFLITQKFSLSSIPVSVATEFGPGGQLKVDDGVRVAFDGPVIAPPLQQIFKNATLARKGLVELRGNRESYVEWWGARGLNLGFDDAPAFQAAIDASRYHLGWNQTTHWGGTAVRFFNGPYRWSSPVHLSGSVTLEGEKPGEFSPSLIVVDADVGAIEDPPGGYDLRLMSVATVKDLVNEGRNLVIVALVGTDLHIRIFDANGKRVVDKAENELVSGETLRALKKGLRPLPHASGLSKEDKQKIIDDAISIAGYTIDGGALVVDWYAYDWRTFHPLPIPRGSYARVRNMSMKQINDPNSLVITCGVKVYANRVQIENFYASGFGDGITITSSKKLSIPMPGGNNVDVNAIADVCELSGTIDLGSCNRYGLWIHGGDANVTNITGSLSVHDCGSWGLVLDSFLGDGALGAFHTASNGVQQFFKAAAGTMSWKHGDEDRSKAVWAPNRKAIPGEIVLPPPARANGWQYRVTHVDSTNPNPVFAAVQPNWPPPPKPDETLEGTTVTDGNGHVFTAWMEEGGSAVRHYAAAVNGMVVIGYLYQELDQQSARLPNSVILGQTKDTEIDPSYAPRWGFSGGVLMPFYYRTSWLLPWGPSVNRPYAVGHPIQVEMGGNYASPFVVRSFDASQVPDNPQEGWWNENSGWAVTEEWYPAWKRWAVKAGVHPAYTSYTINGSRSLPYPGAMCFPHLFVGASPLFGTQGGEVRISAVPAEDTPPYRPDMSRPIANLGAWTPGDWLWNITRNPAQQPLYPVAWRPIKKTGFPTQTWVAETNLPAGTIISPGTPGKSVFRKLDGEKTGTGSPPAWDDTPGQKYRDGSSLWEWWGKEGDSTAWEPVITESPTMLVKDIKDVRRPWTVTLTEDEAAHQRIQFTGELPDDITIIVPPGPASGWVRLFFNNTSGPYSLTVQGSGNDPAISVEQGRSQMLWHDGTTVRAAAPPV